MPRFPTYLHPRSPEEWPKKTIKEEDLRQFSFPKLGRSNPEVMTNSYWVWMIRTQMEAYGAGDAFKVPSRFQGAAEPRWCFYRLGRASLFLPDGRFVMIAGEHEDHYDPDFWIYNEVVVWHPDDRIEIYGYPKEVFPPTDFHTATLVGDAIWLIGNLGYPADREPGVTPVYRLCTKTWAIEKMATSGEMPGWIHHHKAKLSNGGDAICITGGLIVQDLDSGLKENIKEWALDLKTRVWRCSGAPAWSQYLLRRADEKSHHIWEMRSLASMLAALKLPDNAVHDLEEASLDKNSMMYMLKSDVQRLKDAGVLCDVGVMRGLFLPEGKGLAAAEFIVPEVKMTEPVLSFAKGCELAELDEEDYLRLLPHLSAEDMFSSHMVKVNDVPVKFSWDSYVLRVTIQGSLAKDVVETLIKNLREKLEHLEHTAWLVEEVK